jgi:hypothetical protein
MTMALSNWKTWRRILIAAGLGLAAAYGIYLYFFLVHSGSREAIAEADRLDPGWRLEELEQKREPIPDEENGALVVLAAARLWPVQAGSDEQDFWAEGGIEESIIGLPPEMQLSPEQRAALKKELTKAAPASQEARKLLHLSRGRYPASGSREDGTAANLCQDSRRIAGLLHLDSILQAQDKQADDALRTALGVLNAGRSIGDDSYSLSQLVRMGCDTLAIRIVERVLAQGEPSEKSLQMAQRIFEDEAGQPLFLLACRGHRADTYDKMTLSKIPFWPVNFPKILQLENKCVEMAKARSEEQQSRLPELKAEASRLDPISALWFSSFEKIFQAWLRQQAWLRCAYVGLAVERYRQAYGRWPDELAALIPEFLQELPLDPYNASPLKYRRDEQGVVIYSVGPDGEDNGGKFDREDPRKKGTDLGFQLWDVSHRRQPWRSMKKTETAKSNQGAEK